MAGAAQFHLTSTDIQDTSDSSDKEGLWIVTGDLVDSSIVIKASKGTRWRRARLLLA